jgi:hypothetical protein
MGTLFRDDAPEEWGLDNNYTRPNGLSVGLVVDDRGLSVEESPESRIMFDGDELMDLRGSASALRAGDLVETR